MNITKKLGHLLTAVAALTLAAGAAEAQQKLVISTWGFNGDLLEEHLFAPFEAANNVEIVLETGNNSDRLNKVQVRGGSEVDLIYLASNFAQKGIEQGLFATIDRSKIPNIEQIYDIAKAPHGEDYGPAYTVGRYGIIYDSAQVSEPITSWGDLWRAEFEGRASIPDINTTAGGFIVLYAGDRDGADAYMDADAAFAGLAELAPNILTTYSRSSVLANMFAQGEVVAAAAQDFVFSRIKAAVPTAVWADLDEGAYANLNTINIIKGSEHTDLAHAFINWALSQEAQSALAVNRVDAPINATVELTPEQAAIWTYGADAIASLRTADAAKMSAAQEAWAGKWNETFRQ